MAALCPVISTYGEDSEWYYLAGGIIWKQVLDMQLS